MKLIKLFLRFGIGVGFLSAVADRFGMWPLEISAWGTMDNFLAYTQLINPMIPESLIPALGWLATLLEIVFGICILLGFKTEFMAKWSGFLMLVFGLSIAYATGIKGALDYSVFAASGAAFALSTMKEKYIELDLILSK